MAAFESYGHAREGLAGLQRAVSITPERIQHLRTRRPAWLGFCLHYIPDVLGQPAFIGQRSRGDRRRVEFVKLADHPTRWLLVSVKFIDDKREAWVSSAHPIAAEYLTRRLRTGTMWKAREP